MSQIAVYMTFETHADKRISFAELDHEQLRKEYQYE